MLFVCTVEIRIGVAVPPKQFIKIHRYTAALRWGAAQLPEVGSVGVPCAARVLVSICGKKIRDLFVIQKLKSDHFAVHKCIGLMGW